MGENALRCESNVGPDASCKKRECEGLRFCSSECLQRCWRAVNWPKVVYVIEPALDPTIATVEAERLVELHAIQRMWDLA